MNNIVRHVSVFLHMSSPGELVVRRSRRRHADFQVQERPKKKQRRSCSNSSASASASEASVLTCRNPMLQHLLDFRLELSSPGLFSRKQARAPHLPFFASLIGRANSCDSCCRIWEYEQSCVDQGQDHPETLVLLRKFALAQAVSSCHPSGSLDLPIHLLQECATRQRQHFPETEEECVTTLYALAECLYRNAQPFEAALAIRECILVHCIRKRKDLEMQQLAHFEHALALTLAEVYALDKDVNTNLLVNVIALQKSTFAAAEAQSRDFYIATGRALSNFLHQNDEIGAALEVASACLDRVRLDIRRDTDTEHKFAGHLENEDVFFLQLETAHFCFQHGNMSKAKELAIECFRFLKQTKSPYDSDSRLFARVFLLLTQLPPPDQLDCCEIQSSLLYEEAYDLCCLAYGPWHKFSMDAAFQYCNYSFLSEECNNKALRLAKMLVYESERVYGPLHPAMLDVCISVSNWVLKTNQVSYGFDLILKKVALCKELALSETTISPGSDWQKLHQASGTCYKQLVILHQRLGNTEQVDDVLEELWQLEKRNYLAAVKFLPPSDSVYSDLFKTMFFVFFGPRVDGRDIFLNVTGYSFSDFMVAFEMRVHDRVALAKEKKGRRLWQRHADSLAHGLALSLDKEDGGGGNDDQKISEMESFEDVCKSSMLREKGSAICLTHLCYHIMCLYDDLSIDTDKPSAQQFLQIVTKTVAKCLSVLHLHARRLPVEYEYKFLWKFATFYSKVNTRFALSMAETALLLLSSERQVPNILPSRQGQDQYAQDVFRAGKFALDCEYYNQAISYLEFAIKLQDGTDADSFQASVFAHLSFAFANLAVRSDTRFYDDKWKMYANKAIWILEGKIALTKVGQQQQLTKSEIAQLEIYRFAQSSLQLFYCLPKQGVQKNATFEELGITEEDEQQKEYDWVKFYDLECRICDHFPTLYGNHSEIDYKKKVAHFINMSTLLIENLVSGKLAARPGFDLLSLLTRFLSVLQNIFNRFKPFESRKLFSETKKFLLRISSVRNAIASHAGQTHLVLNAMHKLVLFGRRFFSLQFQEQHEKEFIELLAHCIANDDGRGEYLFSLDFQHLASSSDGAYERFCPILQEVVAPEQVMCRWPVCGHVFAASSVHSLLAHRGNTFSISAILQEPCPCCRQELMTRGGGRERNNNSEHEDEEDDEDEGRDNFPSFLYDDDDKYRQSVLRNTWNAF